MFVNIFFNLLAFLGSLIVIGFIFFILTIVLIVVKIFVDVFRFDPYKSNDKRQIQDIQRSKND